MKKNDSLHVEISIFKVEESPIIKKGRLRSVKTRRQNWNNNKHESHYEAREIAIMILEKLTAAE